VSLRKLAVPIDNPMKTNTMTIANPYDSMKFSGLILEGDWNIFFMGAIQIAQKPGKTQCVPETY